MMADLPSSCYIIRSVSCGAFLKYDENFGIALETSSVPFEWDVHKHGNQKYTIQIDKNTSRKHLSCWDLQNENALITDHQDFYTIKPTSQDEQKIYYVIKSGDGRLFKADGVGKPLRVTRFKQQTRDFLWCFEKAKASSSPVISPYSVYANNQAFFNYDGIDDNNPLKEYFALIVDTEDKDKVANRWKNFWASIDKLNDGKTSNEEKVYRVIIFERHGEAASNIEHVIDIARDPPLTQTGYIQACNVQAMYTTENSLTNGGIGIPEISYCSPSMRTMATNSITFAPLLGDPSGAKITTLLYDDCREQYAGHAKSEHRRLRSTIRAMFPLYVIVQDADVPLHDECWPWRESGQAGITDFNDAGETSEHMHQRGKQVLNRIFSTEIDDGKQPFVWITSHYGFIKHGLFEALKFKDFKTRHIPNACAIPIICQSILPLDGFYTIRLDCGGSPLYAHATDDKPDVVLSTDSSTSIWYIECVDDTKKLFTVQLAVVEDGAPSAQPLYWNVTKTSSGEKQVVTSSTTTNWQMYRESGSQFYIETPDSKSYVDVDVASGKDPEAGDNLILASDNDQQDWVFNRL